VVVGVGVERSCGAGAARSLPVAVPSGGVEWGDRGWLVVVRGRPAPCPVAAPRVCRGGVVSSCGEDAVRSLPGRGSNEGVVVVWCDESVWCGRPAPCPVAVPSGGVEWGDRGWLVVVRGRPAPCPVAAPRGCRGVISSGGADRPAPCPVAAPMGVWWWC